MRTIGRHWPTTTANGDRPARCDYCGAMWPLSKLVRDQANLLRCPQEGPGPDAVELSKAQLSNTPVRRRHVRPSYGAWSSPIGATGTTAPNDGAQPLLGPSNYDPHKKVLP